MKTKNSMIMEQAKKLFFIVLTAVTFTLLMSMSSVKADVTATWTESTGALNIIGSGGIIETNITTAIDDKTKIKTVTITGEGITKIGDNVFKNCTNLESIDIQANVTSIGSSAFYDCKNLTSIKIPDGVTSINNDTFSGCTSLTSITLPTNINTIGDRAFYGCSGLTSITLPNAVESIGSYAFYNCSNLPSVTIQNNIKIGKSTIANHASYDIGDNAFASCTNLATAYVPDGTYKDETDPNNPKILNIDYSYEQRRIFPQSTTMLVYSISDSSKSITQAVGNTTAKSIAITEKVGEITLDSISSGVFSSYYKLTTAFVPKDFTTTGAFPPSTAIFRYDKDFQLCDGTITLGNVNATTIQIPQNATSITAGMFKGLENLCSIEVEAGNNTFIAENGVLYTKDKTRLICYPPQKTDLDKFTIPDTVTTIDAYAFYNCSILKKITIPATVTSIDEGAFSGCTNLESIKVEDGNNNFIVDKGVLYTKDKKTLICYPPKKADSSFTVPESVTAIADYAFQDCSNLEKIDLSKSNLTNLSANMFYNTNLSSISLPANIETIEDNTFRDFSNLESISVTEENEYFKADAGVLYQIKSDDGNTIKKLICYPPKKEGTSFEVPESVTEINDCAFSHCTNLKSVTVKGEWEAIAKIRNNNFIIFLYSDSTGSESGIAIPGQQIGKTLIAITGACSGLPTDKKTIIIPPDFFTAISANAFNGCYYADIYIQNGTTKPIDLSISTNSQYHLYNAVTFDANDDSVTTPMPTDFYYGPIPDEIKLTNPGRAFVCWNTKSDGTGTSYHTNLPVPALNLKLYAQWGYTVNIGSHDNCDLTVVVVDSEDTGGYAINAGEAVLGGTKLKVYATAKEGYEISEISVTNATLNSDDGSYTVTGNTEITATAVQKSYVLMLNTQPSSISTTNNIKVTVEGTSVSSKWQVINHGSSVKLEAANSVNLQTDTETLTYNFIGWFLNGVRVTSKPSYTFMMYNNATYEARYKVSGSKIVYFVANGQVIQVVETNSITKDDIPIPPKYHGWTFTNQWKVGVEDTIYSNEDILDQIKTALGKANTVTVTANYKPLTENKVDGSQDASRDGRLTVNLTKNSKTGSAALTPASATAISYTESKWVTYTAPYTDSDTKIFSHWELDRDKISTNPIINFRVAKDCNLAAIYTDNPIQEAPSFELQSAIYESDKLKLKADLNNLFPNLGSPTVSKVIFQYGTSETFPENAPSVICKQEGDTTTYVAIIPWYHSSNATCYIKPIVIYSDGTRETSMEGNIEVFMDDRITTEIIPNRKLILKAKLTGVSAENVTAVQFNYSTKDSSSQTISCKVDPDGEGTYVAEISGVDLDTDYYIQPVATLENRMSVTGDIIKVDPESGYDSEEKACAVIISYGKHESTGGAIFVAHLSPPDGATIVKGGVIATTQMADFDSIVLDFSNAEYVQEWPPVVGKSRPFTYTWIKSSVENGNTIHVRPYIIYEQSGEQHTLIGKRAKYPNPNSQEGNI